MKSNKLPFNLQFFADNDISANTQEVADPVETTAEVVEEPVNEVEESSAEVGATEQAPAEPAAQSQELNAQFAAARRKAEEDYQRKMSGIDGEFKRLFGNQVNPATGRPISSVSEYLQAVEFAQNAARNEELRSKGIDPTMIQEMVNNAPAVRQAQQYLQMTQQEEARKSLEADFKEITKIDPSIKSMEDLQKHASFNTVLAYVRDNGLKLHDAFRLANYQQLTSNNADAARQAAINQARGKRHMETTNGVSKQGKELVQIPSNLLARWQDAYPDMSLEQLTRKYNDCI